jgi:hypothetical protein
MMALRYVCIASAILMANASLAAENQLPSHVVSDGGSFDLTLSSSPREIPLNELFEITVQVSAAKTVRDPNPFWISVDATMPTHQHGMNTRARVEDLGNGKFVIRGMLFHMAGEWELAVDVAKGSVHERAKTVVVVE